MKFNLQTLAGRVFLWQRANQAIYLARNILLARFIAPSEFGDFAAGLNLASYVAILSALEFRTAFFSKKELSPREINTQWTAEMLVGIVTVGIALLLAPFVKEARSAPIMFAMVGLLVVSVLEAGYSSHLYLVEKRLEFPFLSVLRMLVNLGSFLICLGLAAAGWGWKALLVDRVATAVFMGIVLYRRAGWVPRLCLDRIALGWYWGFASVLFLNGLLGKIIFGFDIFVVGSRLGSEATGLYSMAMKWALLPMELGAGFLAVMALSLYSRQHGEGVGEFRAAYSEVTYHIVRFCLAIAVIMVIFMGDFFRLCYGREWAGVPLVFAALLPYAVWRPLYQNVCQALQARRDLWPIFRVMVVQSLVALGLIWWVAPKGLIWVGFAVAAAMGIGHLALEWRLFRQIGHPLKILFGVPVLLAVAAVTVHLFFPGDPTLAGFAGRLLLAGGYGAVAAGEWLRGRNQWSDTCPPQVERNHG